MSRLPASDPYYRRLLAEIADTEWQIVECEFQNAAMRGRVEPPALVAADVPPAPARDRQVSLVTRFDINYWMMTFRVDESSLRQAVAAVGCSAAAVRRHFGR
jgi:hypothetical protein